MITATQVAKADMPPPRSGAPLDPVYRKVRDIVYKASGIYKTDEKLYLLAGADANAA